MSTIGRRRKEKHLCHFPPLESFLGAPLVRLLDRDKVSAFLLEKMYPQGPRCPDCSAPLTGKAAERWARLEYVKCIACQRKFCWRAGSPLDGLHADPCQVLLAVVGLAEGLSPPQIARLVSVSPTTMRDWRNQLLRPSQETSAHE